MRNRKLTLSTQQAKCSSFVIEDLLTIDKVRTLERIFTRFEREQKRCMDIYEFRAAMRQVGLGGRSHDTTTPQSLRPINMSDVCPNWSGDTASHGNAHLKFVCVWISDIAPIPYKF